MKTTLRMGIPVATKTMDEGEEKSNSDGEGEVVDGEAEVEEVRGEGEEVSGQDAVVVLDDVAVMESVTKGKLII